MSLIKSISGIRGTIGGKVSENLTPIDTVKFAAAYGTAILKKNNHNACTILIGRDARISGEMISNLVVNTLVGLGIHIVDLGLSTTPTVEVMVPKLKAQGGIILTASHNPKQWNALKLLNEKGEFISGEEGEVILKSAENDDYLFAEVDALGSYKKYENAIDFHIQQILKLPLVEVENIKAKKLKIVVDCVNSTGGISVPNILKLLGCEVIEMYGEPNGHFPHNPEPLAEHLTEICEKVVAEKADMGIVVDPDVDRLALISENGVMFGEEYTLVAVADYILSKKKGATVSNLSSSRALRDITIQHDCSYYASAVGEVNVVTMMKAKNAVIGGEGNGGIIYPVLHYGRDSLIGIALFLSYFSEKNIKMSELKASFPQYFMSKLKIDLQKNTDVDGILEKVKTHYQNEEISTVDGVKIDFENSWVHLRKSNTEPIIRVYTEAKTQQQADELALQLVNEIKNWQ